MADSICLIGDKSSLAQADDVARNNRNLIRILKSVCSSNILIRLNYSFKLNGFYHVVIWKEFEEK